MLLPEKYESIFEVSSEDVGKFSKQARGTGKTRAFIS